MKGRKPITQCTEGEWREISRKFRACIPPPEGYIWRLIFSKSLHDDWGKCDRKDGRAGRPGTIYIRITRGMSKSETEETLLHEAAHAFDMWTHHAWAGDHSDTFWLWMGRLYRRYHGMETG